MATPLDLEKIHDFVELTLDNMRKTDDYRHTAKIWHGQVWMFVSTRQPVQGEQYRCNQGPIEFEVSEGPEKLIEITQKLRARLIREMEDMDDKPA